MALVYDLLILFALSLAYGGLHLLLQIKLLGMTLEGDQQASMGIGGFIGWCLVLSAFYVFFWRRGGQTLGMRAWRLKLIDDTATATAQQAPPSFTNCCIRCLVAPPLFFLGGMGLWWCWLDPNHRSAYDRLSGTKIVLLPKNRK